MDKKIRELWGKVDLEQICSQTNLSLFQLYEKAIELNLHREKTPNVRRKWDHNDRKILEKYSSCLTISEASNLFYKSYYATYQFVKYLGLNKMVKKKKGEN